MRVKWYGAACIMLESDGTRLLFDPFFSLNDKGYKPLLDELSSVMSILVTHGHLDHIVDIPTIWKHGGGKTDVYCSSTPRKVLISKGINNVSIREIMPNDEFSIGAFDIRVLKGKHIGFDKWIVLKTLFRPQIVQYWKNFIYMFKENMICTEAGETIVYDIRADGKQVLLLGSLNLDADTEYPIGADLLILPLQGRSDISEYALSFIDHLMPKMILLDHYDDAFPPISSAVDTEPFVTLIAKRHPNIPVISLKPGVEWIDIDE
ncbi:MAG: MBL fold metallo-hydrolase [Oscillospiraceae bacterium]|nr:MBL fold metallo-hydrolase [Oscillospiraceae bacterium]